MQGVIMPGIPESQKLEYALDVIAHIGIEKKCPRCEKIRLNNQGYCKKCHLEYNRLWSKNNLKKDCEAKQRWKKANCEKNKERIHRWNKNHPEKNKEALKRWRKKYPEKAKKASQYWRETHPDEVREYRRNGNKKNRATLKGNLSSRMGCAIWKSLHGNKNGRHWESLVGYTAEQLKKHLEKKFIEGMTWELFLKGEIHIDHKIPIKIFNFEKSEDLDFKRCWALSNLQPLWATDNHKKHTKINKPFQPSLIFGKEAL